MKKNRPKQKKAIGNIGTKIAFVVVLLIGLLFVFEAVQDMIMLAKWDSGGVLEYQGNYKASKVKSLRNTNYLFTLENGDTVWVPAEYVEDDDLATTETQLSFCYSAHKGIFSRWTHTAVSITSIDGDLVFLQEGASKGVARGTAIGYSVIGMLCILLVVLLNIKASWYIRFIRFFIRRKNENRI